MKVVAVFLALVSIGLSVPVKLNQTDDFQTYLKMLHGVGPVLGPVVPHGNASPKKHLLGEDVQHDFVSIQFAQFQKQFNKQYKDDEELKTRFHIFQANMIRVQRHQQNERGSARYSVMTPFGDMAEEEFDKYYKMPRKFFKEAPILPKAQIPSIYRMPSSFDWREKGAVTPVKNQGQCGSCWAFSTTGNIEGQWFLRKNKLVSLSEQELVDCDKVDEGCEGGLPSNAYKQIMKLGGLERETNYPYDGSDDACKFKKQLSAVYINSSVSISDDETAMAAWLAQNGPISIGINANAMQFYMGGVSHPWSFFCSKSNLDHGVLIVGYGTDGSTPYWIIKNSWGASWGESGYYRVYRGDGTCGLNKMCTSAVVN